jgi:RNA polymerase sigma-70 factor, ECF subfamily
MAIPTPSGASGPTGGEDVELVQRIRKGEEEALQQLHRRYAPLVFHLACRSLDRAAAEEIVQDTFLAVWRRAGDFDPARGSFRTWLLSIGHHRMLDELRSRSRRPQASGEQLLDPAILSAEEPHPDETLWLEYQRDAVSEALAALPEPQRAALRLAFFADLTHEEVAKALKVPLGTAKTRIRTGLKLLERHLGRLVAVLALALVGSGTWLYHRHATDDLQTGRALHLLSDSQTKALRLVPLGPVSAPETGMHATFRSALGSDLAVLTLTHFPEPPSGTHYVLWLRNAHGWRQLDLRGPDGEGRALQILEGTGLVEAWPLELRITPETHLALEPSTPGLVTWQPPSQDQFALP